MKNEELFKIIEESCNYVCEDAGFVAKTENTDITDDIVNLCRESMKLSVRATIKTLRELGAITLE